jgi:hypothetical protein
MINYGCCQSCGGDLPSIRNVDETLWINGLPYCPWCKKDNYLLDDIKVSEEDYNHELEECC